MKLLERKSLGGKAYLGFGEDGRLIELRGVVLAAGTSTNATFRDGILREAVKAGLYLDRPVFLGHGPASLTTDEERLAYHRRRLEGKQDSPVGWVTKARYDAFTDTVLGDIRLARSASDKLRESLTRDPWGISQATLVVGEVANPKKITRVISCDLVESPASGLDLFGMKLGRWTPPAALRTVKQPSKVRSTYRQELTHRLAISEGAAMRRQRGVVEDGSKRDADAVLLDILDTLASNLPDSEKLQRIEDLANGRPAPDDGAMAFAESLRTGKLLGKTALRERRTLRADDVRDGASLARYLKGGA